MAFFKLKKRCQYCGAVLDKEGTCSNPDCIAFKVEKNEEKPKKEE